VRGSSVWILSCFILVVAGCGGAYGFSRPKFKAATIDWSKKPFSEVVEHNPAMAGLESIRDRTLHGFIYGLFGRGFCLGQHGDLSELTISSDGRLEICPVWPPYAEGRKIFSGIIGPNPGEWVIDNPPPIVPMNIGGPRFVVPVSRFSLKPYDSLSAVELQAALDRLWTARHCFSAGNGRAFWQFATVDGAVVDSPDVKNRAEADAVLKAQLSQWKPWYISSDHLSAFLLPAERVGVLK
jgi:hypothetical protein